MYIKFLFFLFFTSKFNFINGENNIINKHSVNVKIVTLKEIYIYDEIFGKNDDLYSFYLEIEVPNITNYKFNFRVEENDTLVANQTDIIYRGYNQLKVYFVLEVPTVTKNYEIKGEIKSHNNMDIISLFTHNISFIKLHTPTSENILLDNKSCHSKELFSLLLLYENKFLKNFYINLYVEYSDGKMVTIYSSEKESYQMLGAFGNMKGKLPYILIPIRIAKILCGMKDSAVKDVGKLKNFIFSGKPDDDVEDIAVYYEAYPTSKNTTDKSFYLKMMYRNYEGDIYKDIKTATINKGDFYINEVSDSETLNKNLELFINYFSDQKSNPLSTLLILISLILIFYQTIVLFYV